MSRTIIGNNPLANLQIDELKAKIESLESSVTKDTAKVKKEDLEALKQELAEFKENLSAQAKDFAEKKVKDYFEEYKTQIIEQFKYYSKNKKNTLPAWQRDIWDILRKGTYVFASIGGFTVLNQFLQTGDFSLDALRNLGITMAILLAGFVQEHFKNLRKVKEENE